MKSNPMQPVVMVDGIARFKGNPIVRHLLDVGKLSLNDIALMPFTSDDRAQFAQLIGYSVSGFGELSYVPYELKDKADALAALAILREGAK